MTDADAACRPDDLDALLAQFQLTDSGFPSGLYTLSHGLEGFTQLGIVPANKHSTAGRNADRHSTDEHSTDEHSADGLGTDGLGANKRSVDGLGTDKRSVDGRSVDGVGALVADLVRATGTADAAALALAHRAVSADDWGRVADVDRRLHAIKLNREQRTASVRTGRQVLDTAGAAFGSAAAERLAGLVASGDAPGNHAVVVGTIHAGLGVPVERAVASDLFAFAAGCASASVRLGRLDFRRAQALLRATRPEIVRATRAALAARDPRDLHATAPVADAVSTAHERAEARLFFT